MFTQLFIVLGIIFLLSLLGYLIPQLIVRFSKPLDLQNRYGGGFVFITGGNSGIGEAFAKKVAAMGFNIIIVARDEERLNKTASALHEINSQVRVITIKADLSDDPEKVTQQIIQQLEGLDISILFFNAGYGVMELASNPTENTLRQFHSNIVTHQYLFQALYPKLANRYMNGVRRGAVLFTSSICAFFQYPIMVVYGATKAYLGHLGECLSTEADSGVNSRFDERSNKIKLPKLLKRVSQTPDETAELALSGLGRVTQNISKIYQSIET
ncbi:MAG: putative 17 beta-hydroxysteroid dehydrogenase type 3 [Streblomastix strix]|uniref:Putative 17 beta-hydroxysteroid dehydrogenase type 3 n=1 Tax=Streblomastix strix TaxID=222440 RepID=A0A5J4W4K2_9EUKA|nr:MAG: putative 17 beta-hydroxysteroid dehydrogenase type 3 [Streblomastix strix]